MTGRECVHTMYIMDLLRFEWDEAIALANFRKHRVTFDEAKSVFWDDHAIDFFDPDHSDDEDRFLLLGLSGKLRALVVSHCFREKRLRVRIISARKTRGSEEKLYWEER